MSANRPPHLLFYLVVGLGCINLGCFGSGGNRSSFPLTTPKSDVAEPDPTPTGRTFLTGLYPVPQRLEVRPENTANPIGTPQVFIATLYDERSQPLARRRVEWLLEGPGNIIEVDDSGFFTGRGHKIDNKYAVTYTARSERLITRGNSDAADDFMIRPGQSWCIISGATEGETAVTAYVPDIPDRDRSRVVVRSRWFDARWEFPQGAAVRSGSEHILSSRVLRHSDQQPQPNYRVRYKIIDGSSALLYSQPAIGNEQGAQELLAISDTNGLASVRIAQQGREPGKTTVQVEILRQNDGTAPNGVGLLVNRSKTVIEWEAPRVALSLTAPLQVALGEEVPVGYIVKNTGQVDAEAMTVRGYLPQGFDFIDAIPPAQQQGDQLVWNLAGLPAGQAHVLQTRMRAKQTGLMTSTASVVTKDNLRADQGATTEVIAGQLKLVATAVESALVGEEVSVQINASNPGTGPLTNVGVTLQYDGGFTHASQKNPIESTIDRIEPGQAKSIKIPLQGTLPGDWKLTVRGVAGSNTVTAKVVSIALKRGELELQAAATPRVFLNQSIEWVGKVTNSGQLPISNVVVRGDVDDAIRLTTGVNAKVGGNQAQWDIGVLQPGESREVRVKGEAIKLTARSVMTMSATGDAQLSRNGVTTLVSYRSTRGLERKAESVLEVLGVPSLQVEVTDLDDPVTVGARNRYTIRVINRGTLPARDVTVVVPLPAELQFLRGYGPTGPRVKAQEVTFGPIDTLPPDQPVTYTVDVQTVGPGTTHFAAEVVSPLLVKPVRVEESTRILTESGSSSASPPRGRVP